jgi:XTP/dITP diphosphohydrolase
MRENNQELLIATKNAGKIKELKELLVNLPIQIRCSDAFPSITEPEETGASFAENAVLKAKYYALQTKLWALADDSGLEVKALNGAPGVFSARYAGENATAEEKIEKILQELNNIRDRRARFVCTMAIADEMGEIKFVADGVCDGTIALTASGANGFGYDPIFIPDGFSQTFGKLSDQIKRKISHRARATDKIIQHLRRFYAAST